MIFVASAWWLWDDAGVWAKQSEIEEENKINLMFSVDSTKVNQHQSLKLFDVHGRKTQLKSQEIESESFGSQQQD